MAKRKNPGFRPVSPFRQLVDAMEFYAGARGGSEWLNGYRAGKGEPEESNLWEDQLEQWKRAADAQKAFQRVARRVIRAVAKRAKEAGHDHR